MKIYPLKQFLMKIAQFQKEYYRYDNELNTPEITAAQVNFIYDIKNKIAEELARFILDKNITVEILNNELLENKK